MNTDNPAPGLGINADLRGVGGVAEAPAASNGQAPAPAPSAAAEAAPCADCEDGLTIGGPLSRSSERALGAFGMIMGGIILLMGIDLFTGGRVAQLVGLGRGGDSADSST